MTKAMNEMGPANDQACDFGRIALRHPVLRQETGRPAVLAAGEAPPSIWIKAELSLGVSAELVHVKTGQVKARAGEGPIPAGEERIVAFPEEAAQAEGLYEIRLVLSIPGRAPVQDAFSFTVGEEGARAAYLDTDGTLVYVPDAKGNRIPDFSRCGYMGGGVPLPDVPVKLTLGPSGEGDDTARIQEAIDRLSLMPPGPDGFRGALLLRRGFYRIAGTLYIRTGGVVLRGEGQEADGTVLHAVGAGRRDMLRIEGAGEPVISADAFAEITDLYVPSGAETFHVADAGSFAVGDTVAVIRRGNAEWISAIGMDSITPRPKAGGTKQWEPFDLKFDRVIREICGSRITVDAPITCAIEHRWGGGALARYDDSGRIEQVGVENLRVESDFDPSVTDTQVDGKPGGAAYFADENHLVNFVVLNHVKHAWVRDVTGFHLDHSLVTIDRHAKWVIVQDCKVREMVSIITGGRRYAFHVTGQLSLVQRCDVETARHAFVFNARVCGPNVFLDCESRIDFNASEPHHRWSVGGLFDCVKAPIYIRDRGWMGSGHGWAGANYVAWNTEGELTLQQPPSAQNYAVGHVGKQTPPFLPNEHDMRPRQDGHWDRYGVHVEPRSLYLQQLKERMGEDAGNGVIRR